ncbi:GNAT family N-acetyltransferase [Yinghuangia aomiensis]
MRTTPQPLPALRPATRADLPRILALLADEDRVTDPADVVVTAAYERAFAAIDADPRNELLVLTRATGDPADEGENQGEIQGQHQDQDQDAILGCLQATYIPGLGKGGAERVLLEAVRIRADVRGGGLGRTLMELAIERARVRGCALVQLTSNKRRTDAHRFYAGLGFVRSHDGFKLTLDS